LTSTYFGAVSFERPNPVFRQAIFVSAHSDGTYTLYFQVKKKNFIQKTEKFGNRKSKMVILEWGLRKNL